MPLIDICFNFTHESFRKDEKELLNRASTAGVETMIVTGSSITESREAIKLAEKYPEQLYATAGVHPHLATEWKNGSTEELLEMADHPAIVAIGECGLDYNRDFSPRKEQRKAFTQQLEIAIESGLPAFCHERDAHDDFLAILREYRPQLKDVVVHCFTGLQNQLETYLELDAHIGITGWICDERRGHHLREFIHIIPDNRLMIETDAPYLLPRDLKPKPKGRRNEPAFLPHICEAVAQARKQSTEHVADCSTATAKSFYQL